MADRSILRRSASPRSSAQRGNREKSGAKRVVSIGIGPLRSVVPVWIGGGLSQSSMSAASWELSIED